MSNSSLVSYVKLSPHKRSRNGSSIKKITIHHCAVVNGSLEAIGRGFSGARVASSNYCIDSDGKIAMYVEEQYRAITSSNTNNDQQAVTIEVMNCKGAPNWEVSDSAYASLIALCVDICKRNGIKALNFTGDATGNLTQHNYFAATACPGPYLKSKFQDIANQVNAQLNSISTEGSSNADIIKAWQQDLIKLGYDLGTSGADGVFGPKTLAAVKLFQANYKLHVDGIVGPKTLSAIEKALQKQAESYMVRVTASKLNIRKGPSSTKYPVTGVITNQGIYTIVETAGKWGKLKSGLGWIYLPYTKKV